MSKPAVDVKSARQKMMANISFAPGEFVALNVAEDNRMKQVAADDAQVRMLLTGTKFLKYGRRGFFGAGSKHWKFVYCDFDGTIFWADCDAPAPDEDKHPHLKSEYKFSTDASVSLQHMTSIVAGKISDVFKQDTSDTTPASQCLSLVFPDRTLDLVAPSPQRRDQWLSALQFAWQNVKRGNQIGLLQARTEEKADPTSEAFLSGLITEAHKAFGVDHAPSGPKLAEINLRTKDKTEARMYGIETETERNEDLEDFKKKIGSPDRCAQYSWDMCMVFDIGSDAATIAIPKVHIASKTVEQQTEFKKVTIQSSNLAAAQKAMNKLTSGKGKKTKGKKDSGKSKSKRWGKDSEESDETEESVVAESDVTGTTDEEDEDDSDGGATRMRNRRAANARNVRFGNGKKQESSEEDEEDEEDDEEEARNSEEERPKKSGKKPMGRSQSRRRDSDSDKESEEAGESDQSEAEKPQTRKRQSSDDMDDEEVIKSADEFMSERELFTRTTVQVVQSLHVAGLKTCIYSSVDGASLICLIGATEARLEAEAARVGYELQLDPIECLNQGVSKELRLAYFTKMEDNLDSWGTVYGPFFPYVPAHAERHRLYRRWSEPPYHINSFFRSADRIKLITSIIETDLQLGGAGVSPHHFVHHNLHSLHAFFPLEQTVKLAELKEDAFSFTSSFTLSPPIEPIRTYFGEEVALLFAFIRYYCFWLLLPSAVGIFIYIWEVVYRRVDSSWACFFGVLTSVFSLVFLEAWKRKQSEFRVEWGMLRFKDRDVLRPQFFGNWGISSVNGRPERQFSSFRRLPRYLLTYTAMCTFIAVSVVAVVGLLIFRMSVYATATFLGPYYFSCFNAVQIQILNWVWDLVAVRLTEFENHRVQSRHDSSLLTKSFLFKLVNSYISLFYMAFLQQYDPWVPNCHGDGCLQALQQHLGFLVVTQLIFSNLGHFVVPYIVRFIIRQQWAGSCFGSDEESSGRARRHDPYGLNLQVMETIAAESVSANAQIGVSNVSAAEVQSALPPHDTLVQDYEHLLFQFGYATLFSIAFPLAPLCILVSTIMWSRNLMLRMCSIYRRPEPRGTHGIGPFFVLFNIMSAFAIVTNMGIVMFTSSFYSSAVVLTFSYQLVSFIVVEHIVLVIKLLLMYLLDEVPQWVRHNVRRQEVIVGVLLFGQQERRDMTTLPFVAPPISSDLGGSVDWASLSTDPRDIVASSEGDLSRDAF